MDNKPISSKNILISMILATHNEQEHISNCINSLLTQSYPQVEIIITDDGSVDKTVEIITKLKKKNKNIKLVKQNHLGMAQAWNNSFKHSKGNIAIMFGADMVAGKDFIKELVRPIIEEGALGSRPIKEKIQNANNLWARVKGKERIYSDTTYLAIRRDAWIKVGGADITRGYDADQSFYDALKIKPKKVRVEIYHYHPASFNEFWKQSIWIGRSMTIENKVLFFLALPFIPLIIIYKSIKTFIEDPYPPFIIFLPFYNILKYIAFLIGNISYIVFKKRKR